MRIISIDTETGGFDPQRHAIISLGACVWEGHVVAEQEWVIKDTEGELDAGALQVNGFSRDIIAAKGQPAIEVLQSLQSFVFTHCGGDPRNVVPVGHNLAMFDFPFLHRLARIAGYDHDNGRTKIEAILGRRPIDTMIVARFLQYTHILPPGEEVKLSTLMARYLPHLGPQTHGALDDARRTAMILDALEDEVHRTIDTLAKEAIR